MIRLFAALAIPDIAAQALRPLAEGVPGARWSRPENLHLTLRFAGPIDEAQADDLDLELAAVSCAPFDLTLTGVGAFGTGDGLRAIWVGVESSEGLTQLQRRCEGAARRASLKPDRRAWTPHVTLAYLRDADPARIAAWTQRHNLLRLAPFRVDRFGLYSSWPTREGSTYRLERTYDLTP